MRAGIAALITAAAVFVGGACANNEDVGSKDLLEFDEQEAGRIGEIEATTTTAVPAPTTSAAPVATTAKPVTTTAKPAATTAPPTTAAAAPAFTVKIISGGQGFDPFNFAVKKGTRLTIVNEDNQARTFTSDEPGAFDSGPLAPGASFTYVADRLGKFNFHDETRPFAVGQMEVTP